MTTEIIRALSTAERRVIAHLVAGAEIYSTNRDGYYHVRTPHGEELKPRIQHRVITRLEKRGYLAYANNTYTLSDAGRRAAPR